MLEHEFSVLISLLCYLILTGTKEGVSDDDCIDDRHNAEHTETTSLLFSDLNMVLHLRLQINFLEGRGPEDKGDEPHLSRKKAPPVLHENNVPLWAGCNVT